MLQKFFLPIMVRKGMLPVNVLKTPASSANDTFILTSEITFATLHIIDDDIRFCAGPGMLIGKTTKPCINSTWIFLLIHGFVPVKTWLLMVCDTAFYAIIHVKILPENLCNMIFPCATPQNNFVNFTIGIPDWVIFFLSSVMFLSPDWLLCLVMPPVAQVLPTKGGHVERILVL